VQDRNAAAPGLPGAELVRDWVLTLDLTGTGRLLAVLSDGHLGCEVAEGPWPPTTPLALPEPIARALGRVDAARLRLQLRSALDAWPWERELTTAADHPQLVPRYLTDLPEPANPTLLPTSLVAPGTAGDAYLALVQAAQSQRRPLVLADPAVPEAQRLALERSLRSHWRDPLLLSQALAQTLAHLGLSQTCCRLYGDGRAQLADTEQGWRPVTALSIDLVSSTLLLHSLGAEDYARRLQAYHERCRGVVLRFEGSLDTPQGDDGLMAYFGFPLAVEDAAARGLTAAWWLASGMDELGLQVRIGVASGQVAVSAQQAFGPEVHLAARLCAAARPGEILVAPSTRDRVGAGFVLEPYAKELTLKDFDKLKSVYRLSALRSSTSRNVPHQGGTSSFVGRHRELDLLRNAWAAACKGHLQACLVQGEAGIGKSRLLQEFSRELRAQGQHCLELTGQAQASSSPFAAVVDALRQHWAIDPDIDVSQLRGRLASLLPLGRREADELDDLARLLVQSRSDEAPPTLGGQRRWSELLLDCLFALTENGPFCLLVDDAHWLDPSSVELLRRLRDASAGHPLLVVLGERTESGRATTLASAAPLELQGLTDDEAHELALQLGAALPAKVRQRIIERAEGVPLYLEESLRMFSHRDDEAGGDVPATLQDLLMVRLDELGPDRALAQLVSVLGREFSALHLEALLEQDDPFVERARQQGSLGSLLNGGLLQVSDGPLTGYRFKHALIRDAAYGSIWTNDRKRLHGLCADLIERSTPELWRQRPEHLAHHLEAAGRLEQARRAWLAAAQLAATRHAHQETVELAKRALALHEQVPDDAERARSAMRLHLLLASAQIALQGYGSAEVEAAYRAAEKAGKQLTDAAHALRIRLGLEACCVMRGDLQGAAELAQAAVEATDWTNDARLALQSRWALANVRFHQGDWPTALAGFDECLAHYRSDLHRSSGVQDPAIMCLGYSSWIHFELGQADESLRRIARMLELAEALQHPFSTGVALGFAASVKRLCGDVEGAWPHALDAVRTCERGGFQVWLAHAWMVCGQLRSERGDAPGGADDMDRGYGMWVGSGARISCAVYLATRAELLLRQGQTQRAASDLEQAWRISEQIGEHYHQAELLRLQGLCAWQAGDRMHAEHTLRQALGLAERQRKPGLALRCALSLGALQASQGQWQEPVQRLRSLLNSLPRHGSCRDFRWARQALMCWETQRAFDFIEHTPWEPR
jgi:class 3 adenylate cyclase/tetratricopeptide (TPR) repeat protein